VSAKAVFERLLAAFAITRSTGAEAELSSQSVSFTIGNHHSSICHRQSEAAMRIEELDTPAVIVDLDILEANLRSLASYCRKQGIGLRPHTKTHKSPAIAKMQIASGCRGITVAKIGEAEVMASTGLDDILIAYPLWGTAKLERLTKLAQERRMLVSLDSLPVAQGISEAARRAGCDVNVLIEFDVGMRRCGIQSVEQWLSLAQAVDGLPGLRFSGLMFYPGHIWDRPPDQGPALEKLSQTIEEIQSGVKKIGLSCEIVSGGSTPSAYNSHQVRGLTEIRAGTYVFYDMNETKAGYSQLSDCALKVMVTVVSNAVQGRAIIDGGSKTFSGDRLISGDKQGFGCVTEHPEVQFVAMSEEHGHLELGDSGYRPQIGEKLTIIPNHVCTCVNMHDQIYYHRNGIVEGSWVIAGRGKVR
jgi:D-serine deaminase-like pyridoxal phosphate-dependent protein